MSTVPSSYTEFIARLCAELLHTTNKDISLKITDAAEHFKYVGFDLNVIAERLASRSVSEIVQLLAIFHTRGTKVSKMKKSMQQEYLSEFNELTKGIKDNSTSDKNALTLSRISLAVPGLSVYVATKVEMNQISVKALSNIHAVFSTNTVPGILTFKNIDWNKQIWKCFVIANATLTLTVSKQGTITPAEAVRRAAEYGMLTAKGMHDDLRMTSISIILINGIRITDNDVDIYASRLGILSESIPTAPEPTRMVTEEELEIAKKWLGNLRILR